MVSSDWPTGRGQRVRLGLCAGVLAASFFGVTRAQQPPAGTAQQPPAAAAPQQPAETPPDPRVGLKAGIEDAGVAALNMELVAHLPKPEGFSDPTGGFSLNFANSDLAFKGTHLYLGNFHGFNFYNIEDPKKPQLRVSVPCPGGQGDLSVYRNLMFMSVEQPRGRVDCGTQGVEAAVSPERFRGVRIFDISDLDKPRQIAAVQTCRGSHTHTLLVDPKDKANIYIYGSGTSGVRSAEELAGCSGMRPEDDPNTALFSIDVIQVPLAAPEKARIVSRPRIFADPKTGAIGGLWPGGDHGRGTQRTSTTNQCHDVTVFPEIGLAAGACSGNGILLDISDPVNPVRLDYVSDPSFAYWHSATFNNDGTKVVFTDEWGGGTAPRCRATDLPTWGANAIFDIENRRLRFGGYYKLPAPQTEQENCVAHNGSIIPVPGRDIMVQGWYQGGVTVFDFTDSSKPVEIAYFDRGPIDANKLLVAGFWSTYWYNGFIYGSDLGRGLDIFRLTPSAQLSQNEIDAAGLVRLDEFNAQHQTRLTWPATFVVARAYLDQLERTRTMAPDRLTAMRTAIDQAEKAPAGKDRRAAVDQLEKLAGQLETDAAKAAYKDQGRLTSLAATIKSRVKALR
jgi:hypothetical protein